MHDIVIRNGQVVDGTRRSAFPADIAIDGDMITAVQPRIAEPAHRTIDADGAIVTPGFVDIHTHYDGQVTWDDLLDPSASHGTTTVITGNCGVGFAPVRPGQHQALIELMEGVEDIPGTALYEGIDWSWESFPEYLDCLRTRRWSMDVGAQVAHGPMRVYVMGERGIRNERATPDDIDAMVALTRDAMAAGAMGLSMSRILGHQSVHGDPVPGTFAAADEVFAIGRAMAPYGRVFEVVPGGSVGQGGMALGTEASLQSELDWMKELSIETGLAITFLIVEFGEDPGAYAFVLDYVARRQQRRGATVPADRLATGRRPAVVAVEPPVPASADLPEDRRSPVRGAAARASSPRGPCRDRVGGRCSTEERLDQRRDAPDRGAEPRRCLPARKPRQLRAEPRDLDRRPFGPRRTSLPTSACTTCSWATTATPS